MHKLSVIFFLTAMVISCRTQPPNDESQIKDISIDDRVRYQTAVIFSGVDGEDVGHVFFKVCQSGTTGRGCVASGATEGADASGNTYQDKKTIDDYERALPRPFSRKILRALTEKESIRTTLKSDGVNNDRLTVIGGGLTPEEVKAALDPFGWPGNSGNVISGMPDASKEADSQLEPVRLNSGPLGFRCSTPQGICSLPKAQPIGTPCRCEDDRSGTTIR